MHVDRKRLLDVARLAPKKGLGAKAIRVGPGQMQVTDGDICITIGSTESDEHCVSIPPKQTIAALKGCKERTVCLTPKEDGIFLEMGCASELLQPELGAELPYLPTTIPDAKPLRLDADTFALAVKRVTPMAATEPKRYALESVCLDISPVEIRFVATDAVHLAMQPWPSSVGDPPSHLPLIPPHALTTVLKLAKGRDVEIQIGTMAAAILAGDVTVHTRLIEGRFPRYRDVVEPALSAIETRITVQAGAFADLVGRWASGAEPEVAMFFGPEVIQCRTPNGLVTAHIDTISHQGPIRKHWLRLDARRLVTPFRALPADYAVEIGLPKRAKDPIVVTANGGYVYLLGPLVEVKK